MRQSLNMNSASWAAAVALSRLNHAVLSGKPMRIMWCQRDPSLRKAGIANLFVKNLDRFSVTDARLEEIFRKFGTILSCKVARDDKGQSKGFGFVQFDSEESANDALTALDGSTFYGRIISVAKFIRKTERKEPEFTNIYVKNLDKNVDKNLLEDTFSLYGKVTSAVIIKDDKGKSRGFGFVNFESHDCAKKAIEALNGSSKWFVGKAMNKAERERLRRAHLKENPHPLNLFVSNLPYVKKKPNSPVLFVCNLAPSVNERNLEEVFGAFGHASAAKVIRHKNGLGKGFGYVCFSTPEEATKARDVLIGSFYHGKYMYMPTLQSKGAYVRKLTHFALQYPSNLNTWNNQYLPSYNNNIHVWNTGLPEWA